MEIVELQVVVEKSQLAALQAEVNALKGTKIPVGAGGTGSSGTSGLNNYTKSLKSANEQAGTFQKLMGASFKQITAQMAMWQVMGTVIAKPIAAVKDALNTMKQVDSELVTIQKVTNFSNQQMKEIEAQSYKTASAYGVAADAYLESVAAFARAGYKDQSEQLGELAVKTQIVGDTTADVANQFLLSVDKAYKYNGSVTELMRVLDGADYINNNYATSIEKIAEGMGIVAPVADQAHIGVDELMASMGTITAVTQRSGFEAARAYRALVLNILGDTKTEIEDGATWTAGEIEGLRDVLRTYAPEAVKAAEATGEIINPMEAMKGLAQSMKDGVLTEQKLMEMVSDIGGKLRTSQLLALIENWDMYESMLADYQTAAGTADKEIELAMNSWERKAEVLKNTWTEFVSNVVNTDLIKGGLDAMTGFIGFLDSDLGAAATKAAALSLGLYGVSKALVGIGNAAKGSAILSTMTGMLASTRDLKAGFALLGEGITAALSSPVGLTMVAVAAIGGMIAAVNEATWTFEEQQTQVENLAEQYESLYGAGTEYAELVSKMNTEGLSALTDTERQRLGYLTAGADQMERQLQAEKELLYTMFQRERGDQSNTHAQYRSRDTGEMVYRTNEDEITADVKAFNELQKAQAGLKKSFLDGLSSASEYKAGLADLVMENQELYDTLKQFEDWGLDLSPAEQEFMDLYDTLLELMNVANEDLQVKLAIDNFGAIAEIGEKSAVNWQALKRALEDAGATAEDIAGVFSQLSADENVVLIDVEADGAEDTLEKLKELGVAVEGVNGTEINVDVFSALTTELGLSHQEAMALAEEFSGMGVVFTDAAGNAIEFGDALNSALAGAGAPIATIKDQVNDLKESLLGLGSADVTVTATDAASQVVEAVQGKVDTLAASDVNPQLNATDNVSGVAAVAKKAIDAVPVTHTTTFTGNTGALAAAANMAKGIIASVQAARSAAGLATGTQNWQGGPVLLGDEKSTDGAPRPELVITKGGKAFVAGMAGPVMTDLPAGSRVFPYSDTKDILSGADMTEVAAFAGGNDRIWNAWNNRNNTPAAAAATAGSGGGGNASGGTTGGNKGGGGKAGAASTNAKTRSKAKSGGTSSSSAKKDEEDEYLKQLQDELALLEAQYDLLEAQGAETGELTAKSREIQNQLHLINNRLRETDGDQKEITENSTKWYKELQQIQEKQKQVFEDQIDLLETELDLLEKQGGSAEDRIAKNRKIQDQLHREAEFLRSIGGSQEEINKLSIKWLDVQQDILDIQQDLWDELDNAIQNELKKAADARDDELEALDKELKALQEARDAKNDQLTLEEKLKKVEEARFALENTQNERNIRYFNAATGQWEWTADAKTVADARKSLEEAERDLADYREDLEYQAAVDAIERRREAINAAYDNLEAGWEKITRSIQEPGREIADILADIARNGTKRMKEQVDATAQLLGDLNNYIRAAINQQTGDSYLGGEGQPSQNYSGDKTDYAALMKRAGDEAEFQYWAEQRTAKVNAQGIDLAAMGWETNAQIYDQWKKDQAAGKSYASSSGAKTSSASSGAEKGSGTSSSLRENLTSKAASAAGVSTATAKAALKKVGIYDSGGVLTGLGGIKATAEDEMVVPPEITKFMLSPKAEGQFKQRMAELGFLYGGASGSAQASLQGRTGGGESHDHYGDVYQYGDIRLTEAQARGMTVYDLAQRARSLGIYNGA